MSEDTLYHRLGGYDAIAAVTDHALPRLLDDPLLKAYFNHLSQDSFRKLRQKFVDILVSAAGRPIYYTGLGYAHDARRAGHKRAGELRIRGPSGDDEAGHGGEHRYRPES